MKTLLLLAGRSTRFWPLSEKSLWPFLGEPLLAHQMRRLREGGLTDITFVGGAHNLASIRGLFPDAPVIEQEDLDLGMRGAVLSGLSSCGDEPVCIVSGNDVIDPSGYRALVKAAKGVDGAVLAKRVEKYFPGGYLKVGSGKWEVGSEKNEAKNGNSADRRSASGQKIEGIIEKPGEGNQPSDLVNIVAHVHNDPQKLLSILQGISADADGAYEEALSQLCEEKTYLAVPYEGAWNAVKYPWHILDLTERLLRDIRRETSDVRHQKVEIHKSAVVEGPVILEEGVRILPHASVIGPCYIGKGTIIGNNCLIRDSIIGEQCVIGFGSEIARSNLHSHVWTHSTYLGDSVIGKNVAFGAGSTTANFRLDEGEINSIINGEKISAQRVKLGLIAGENVRCGVQTVFAPGIKIGAGSFINSAVSVTKDVGENKYVVVKDGVLEERENRVGELGLRT